jgi:hypothetical protein
LLDELGFNDSRSRASLGPKAVQAVMVFNSVVDPSIDDRLHEFPHDFQQPDATEIPTTFREKDQC